MLFLNQPSQGFLLGTCNNYIKTDDLCSMLEESFQLCILIFTYFIDLLQELPLSGRLMR